MKRKTIINLFVVGLLVVILAILLTTSNENQMTQVLLETSMGNIKINLYSDMPITTGNFEKLVGEGFYDGTKFHRVIDNFMIQGGDPLTKDDSQMARWGTGGSEPIKDEFTHEGGNRNDYMTIAMANAGPNTGSSQFFINVNPQGNNYLDTKHPAFGKVVEGEDIVLKISKVETGEMDRPVEAVTITKASVVN